MELGSNKYKKTGKNMQQQKCQQLIYIYRYFVKAETLSFKCIHQIGDHAI